jgi:hypothetical protein
MMRGNVIRRKVSMITVDADRHHQVGALGNTQRCSQLFQQHSADFGRLLEVSIVRDCVRHLRQLQ